MDKEFEPSYTRWRHGGWYVHNVRYPSGAIGCVSNNYVDKKWRVVCGPHDVTFSTRNDAAKAELIAVEMLKDHLKKVSEANHETFDAADR